MSSVKQPYNKPALSFEEQAKLLIQRGLIADLDELTQFLTRTNYYRFSTYLYPFRMPGSHDFQPNTEFPHVRMLHDFDQALRVILFNAISAIEISILRTHFVAFFTHKYGAFGYLDLNNLNMPSKDHKELLRYIKQSFDASKEEFAKHFRGKYSDPYLPLWMAVETMSFGNVKKMVDDMHYKDKKDFARGYGVAHKVMTSWLLTLNYIRNCCAHHARLWNRELAIKPLFPDKKHRPEFHTLPLQNSRIFAVLTIIQYLLNIVDNSHTCNADVVALLGRYPDVPIDKMGFPNDWQNLPMWKR